MYPGIQAAISTVMPPLFNYAKLNNLSAIERDQQANQPPRETASKDLKDAFEALVQDVSAMEPEG
jgi:hypothetical protein